MQEVAVDILSELEMFMMGRKEVPEEIQDDLKYLLLKILLF